MLRLITVFWISLLCFSFAAPQKDEGMLDLPEEVENSGTEKKPENHKKKPELSKIALKPKF